MMNIGYFEAGDRRLLGSVQLAPRLRTADVAVLLCNPFGEEAARAHRAYRVLAARVNEAGYGCMRFDYSGTGDSSGDAADCTLDDWLDDIAIAANELLRQSGSRRVVLVGLRFGATLAALCARRQDLRVAHLVLWDPVVEGTQYLRELAQMHAAYLREELGGSYRPGPAPAPGQFPTEALGMAISPRLAADIAGIDLAADAPAAPFTTILRTRQSQESARLFSRWAECPAIRWIDVVEGSSWNSDAALNSALVPAREIAAIVSRIKECSP